MRIRARVIAFRAPPRPLASRTCSGTVHFYKTTSLVKWRSQAIALIEDLSGVENRRSSGSLPVACVGAAFAGRASVRFGMALVPVPAHRTGQAHLAHPALGERFTVSPTESCLCE